MIKLPRGIPRKDASPSQAKRPDAQWLDADELGSEFDYTKSHVFLGAHEKRLIGVKDDRHHLLIAGSRAGKGRSVIINNLLHYRGSALVIDPKGENAYVTALRRHQMGQTVHVLDPFGKSGEHIKQGGLRSTFNPLSILRPNSKTLVDDAALIADAIVIPSGGDTHWDESAKNFLKGIMLHVATHPRYESKRNLITVAQLAFESCDAEGKEGLEGLQCEMVGNEAANDAVYSAATEFFDKEKGERSSVLSSLRKHLDFLRSEAMQSVLQGDELDLAELKRGETTVYLCLPAGRMGTNRRWLRLFVNLAIEALEREIARPETPPVLLLLDEFPVLGHMAQIEDAAGQIAGFGVKLFIVIQDLSQLKTLYRDRWETFVGNAGVVQCFGNSEATTTHWISNKLGDALVPVNQSQFRSRQAQTNTGDTGLSKSDQHHPLLTHDEVARLFARENNNQIVFVNGRNPLALDRVLYDQDPSFSKFAYS